jgi:hypothetical protein
VRVAPEWVTYLEFWFGGAESEQYVIGREALQWVPFERGLFDVISFHNDTSSNDGSRFPWNSVWKTKAPLGWPFFLVWLAAYMNFYFYFILFSLVGLVWVMPR